MSRLSIVIFCGFILSGCAFSTLDKGLPLLLGEPIERAVDVLGFPNSSMDMAGYKIYVWDNRYNSTIPIVTTNTATTTGSVGTIPVYGTTMSTNTNFVPVTYQCQIKLSVDEYGKISRWEYSGNQGGCRYYANGIERIIP